MSSLPASPRTWRSGAGRRIARIPLRSLIMGALAALAASCGGLVYGEPGLAGAWHRPSTYPGIGFGFDLAVHGTAVSGSAWAAIEGFGGEDGTVQGTVSGTAVNLTFVMISPCFTFVPQPCADTTLSRFEGTLLDLDHLRGVRTYLPLGPASPVMFVR